MRRLVLLVFVVANLWLILYSTHAIHADALDRRRLRRSAAAAAAAAARGGGGGNNGGGVVAPLCANAADDDRVGVVWSRNETAWHFPASASFSVLLTAQFAARSGAPHRLGKRVFFDHVVRPASTDDDDDDDNDDDAAAAAADEHGVANFRTLFSPDCDGRVGERLVSRVQLGLFDDGHVYLALYAEQRHRCRLERGATLLANNVVPGVAAVDADAPFNVLRSLQRVVAEGDAPRWRHIAVVSDGTLLTMFVDGERDASRPLLSGVTFARADAAPPLWLVGRAFDAARGAPVQCGEQVALLSDQLDARDVRQLAAAARLHGVDAPLDVRAMPSAAPVLVLRRTPDELGASLAARAHATLARVDYFAHLELAEWRHCYFWTHSGAQHSVETRANSLWHVLSGASVCLPLIEQLRDGALATTTTTTTTSSTTTTTTTATRHIQLCASAKLVAVVGQRGSASSDASSVRVSLDLRFAGGAWQYDNELRPFVPRARATALAVVAANATAAGLRRALHAAPVVRQCVVIALRGPLVAAQLALVHDAEPLSAVVAFSNISLRVIDDVDNDKDDVDIDNDNHVDGALLGRWRAPNESTTLPFAARALTTPHRDDVTYATQLSLGEARRNFAPGVASADRSVALSRRAQIASIG